MENIVFNGKLFDIKILSLKSEIKTIKNKKYEYGI